MITDNRGAEEGKVIGYEHKATDCSDLNVEGEGAMVLAQGVREVEHPGTETKPNAPGSTKQRGRRTKQVFPGKIADTGERASTVCEKGPPCTLGNATASNSSIMWDLIKKQGDQIEELRRELHVVGKHSEFALGRHRNVVIKGIPEPYMRESRQRARAIRYHTQNLLRTVRLPPHTTIKRVLRIGKWSRDQAPRPVVVEFTNPRTRDRFLAQAAEVSRLTEGKISIEPDESPRSKETLGRGETPQHCSPILRIRTNKVLLPRNLGPTEGTPANPASEETVGAVTTGSTDKQAVPRNGTAARKHIEPKNGQSSRA